METEINCELDEVGEFKGNAEGCIWNSSDQKLYIIG